MGCLARRPSTGPFVSGTGPGDQSRVMAVCDSPARVGLVSHWLESHRLCIGFALACNGFALVRVGLASDLYWFALVLHWSVVAEDVACTNLRRMLPDGFEANVHRRPPDRSFLKSSARVRGD